MKSLGAPIGIKDLNGIAIEDTHDLAREAIGVGERQEQQGEESKNEDRAKQRNRHEAPRTTNMGAF
ncbi:hypothetical protein [Thiocapsa imhoffii]|uniref:hypothetical protein n=1 Tax=Thiocapsa imhoffii TaxID=382777 RepID=UPI0019055974|nr:hypothetical protein [Thiocapsa imhoffii]